MIELLAKPLGQIAVRDFESLVELRVPENEQIEFKEALSARDGAADAWTDGRNRIGDRAKNSLLKEVTAFANAYGGALILGIRESGSNPPAAEALVPVPRCSDLAERLKLIFRDRVEPQLPSLEVLGVPIEDESGVVLLRVGHSRRAPHRITKTNVCPVRRADRCEEMTMREVQDMTLTVSRGLERLERRFADRRDRFKAEYDRLNTPLDAFGFRITGVPLGDDIHLDRVFRHNSVVEGCAIPRHRVRRHEGNQQFNLDFPPGFAPQSWRPLLRGARADTNAVAGPSAFNCYGELLGDGLVELGFLSSSEPFEETALSPDWPIVMFANLVFGRAEYARTRRHRRQNTQSR